MKSPAGHNPARRRVAKKQVRLDLRRAPPPPDPEDERANRQQSNFWKWFGLVALFHLLIFLAVMFFYYESTPPPEPQFMSLVPLGDTVKGTPGTQEAPKLGTTTAAPAKHKHHVTPPKPTPTPPTPVTPPPVAQVQPPPADAKPIIHQDNAPTPIQSKPKVVKTKPAKPKIKVDLTLADGPAVKTPPKRKHEKKSEPAASDKNDDQDNNTPDSTGLSKMQVASLLGKKIAAAGIDKATKTGVSGSADGHANPFADFYASIQEQVMNKWQNPAQDDQQAKDPVVQIHVEKDGRVPAEQVVLLHSSGNQAIDDSAVSTAKSLGYTLQPLPDGCPPDISINFQITH